MTDRIKPSTTPTKPPRGAASPTGSPSNQKPKPIVTEYSRAKAAGGTAAMGSGIGNTAAS